MIMIKEGWCFAELLSGYFSLNVSMYLEIGNILKEILKCAHV